MFQHKYTETSLCQIAGCNKSIMSSTYKNRLLYHTLLCSERVLLGLSDEADNVFTVLFFSKYTIPIHHRKPHRLPIRKDKWEVTYVSFPLSYSVLLLLDVCLTKMFSQYRMFCELQEERPGFFPLALRTESHWHDASTSTHYLLYKGCFMSTGTQPGRNTEKDEQMHTSSSEILSLNLTKVSSNRSRSALALAHWWFMRRYAKRENEELRRTLLALVCSAVVPGLSMGFSLVGMGVLHSYLPVANWRPLVDSFGYSIGFLIVILGRQQLFTENTVTVILPLLAHFNKSTLLSVLRLWSIVFIGNLIGTALFATVIAQTSIFPPHVRDTFTTMSQEALAGGFGLLVLKGIFAGWLIALMVWLLPAAESTRLHTIIFITYIIGRSRHSRTLLSIRWMHSIWSISVKWACSQHWEVTCFPCSRQYHWGSHIGGGSQLRTGRWRKHQERSLGGYGYFACL